MTDDPHARANAEQVRLLREALAGTDAADRPEEPAAAQSAPHSGPHRGVPELVRSP